jgi:hypothetical protein
VTYNLDKPVTFWLPHVFQFYVLNISGQINLKKSS